MNPEERKQLLKEKGENEDHVEKRVSQLITNTSITLVKEGGTKSMVKSPSDITLYRPAFVVRDNMTEQVDESHNDVAELIKAKQQENLVTKISNFAETIRMSVDEPVPSTSRSNNVKESDQLCDLRERVDSAILQAEKFKEAVKQPGNDQCFVFGNMSGRTDDDFFHLMCHIDSALKTKIERGEYVDLEKLLPKDGLHNDNRLEWVHQEGSTFLAPVSQRETKISNVRKWDQAFRVYATFYCGANPARAQEVWQYVDVIHTAAWSFSWENVYNYDVTFHYLMEFNPNRSWAVTHNHM